MNKHTAKLTDKLIGSSRSSIDVGPNPRSVQNEGTKLFGDTAYEGFDGF